MINSYARNLEQDKYKNTMEKMNEISQQVGYDVLVCNNNDIIPVSDIQNTDLQRVAIFDDSMCVKKIKSNSLIISFKDDIRIAQLST